MAKMTKMRLTMTCLWNREEVQNNRKVTSLVGLVNLVPGSQIIMVLECKQKNLCLLCREKELFNPEQEKSMVMHWVE